MDDTNTQPGEPQPQPLQPVVNGQVQTSAPVGEQSVNHKRSKNKFISFILILLALAAITLLVAPIVSASMWKSSTLQETNDAIDTINQTSVAIKEFDSNAEATSADFDNLLKAYKDEQSAIKGASVKASDVGGFKGLDPTGDYKNAEEISKKMVGIFDELLAYNAAELASAEAEKQLVIAIEQNGTPEDAAGLSAQAQSIRSANQDYQKYLQSSQASELEAKFSSVYNKLADALDQTAKAISSNNLTQLDAADKQLQVVINEIDALEPERKAQTAINQQKLNKILDKLNATAKELE